MRERITIGFAVCIVIIFLPYFLTLMITGLTGEGKTTESIHTISTGKTVSVEYGGEYKVLDVEEYLLGVLPGVAGSDQEPEVWKALAVIERTNIYRQMDGNTTVDEADLTEDYLTEEEIRELWGERRYQRECSEVEQAILATAGQTMTYDGEYILACYHMVSDGTTVSAEEMTGQAVPYLVSVDSGRDVESKDYMSLITISKDEWKAADGQARVLVVDKATEHGYVQEVSIGEDRMSADEFCRKYQIPSYHFYIEDLGNDSNSYRIVALGKGSGMGLSIYGAGVMSRDGKDYTDILKYYYPGVQII